MDAFAQVVDSSDTRHYQPRPPRGFLGAGNIRLTSREMEEFDREYVKIDLMGHRADPFTESQIDK